MKAIHWKLALSLILLMSLEARSEEQGVLKDAQAFVGIGPSFGTLAVGNLQVGGDFLVLRQENFSLYAGPLVVFAFSNSFIGGDFDGLLKGSYKFQLSDANELDIYGKALLGISFANIGTGFNAGLGTGVEFYFNQQWGVFTELGFLHRSYFVRLKNAPASIGIHQPSLAYSLGAIYRF
jgi:hypothetical protein